MRVKSLLFVVLFAFSSGSVFAQEKEQVSSKWSPREYSATVNPLGILLNSVNGEFAVRIFDNIAFTIPVSIYYTGYYTTSAFPISWGISAGVGAKIFLGAKAIETGWWVEPQMLLGFSQNLSSYNSFLMSPVVMGGYGWVWDNGFTLNVAGGLMVAIQSYNTQVGANVWPKIEASLGYSW